MKYEPGRNNAPRIAAKGSGDIAERIVKLAEEKGIPIRDDPDLVLSLMQLDWHEEIPPALYQAVAEILAFAYRMNRQYRGES